MQHWDVVVIGGGPAGAAAAASARHADPAARVLVLDRTDFPRDKACGDGVTAEVFDVLARLGLDRAALTEGFAPVPRLRLRSPVGATVDRAMRRPAAVVPRAVFDHRLLTQALASGAEFRRHTVRRLTGHPTHVDIDGELTAGAVIGADGAESVVRRALGLRARRTAVAIRGYAPVPPGLEAVLLIATTERRWPAYAWSFPLGDGRANVGYGERVSNGVTRAGLLDGLARLLPGVEPAGLRAHRLPLSTGRPRQPDGRVLLAGDAASLINPLTGEGIFYAVLTGALAGTAALHGADAGRTYRRAVQTRLGPHLRHCAAASAASRWPRLMDATVRATAADQRVFDDAVRLGLAGGRLSARTLAAVAGRLPSAHR